MKAALLCSEFDFVAFFKTTYDCTVNILLHPTPYNTEKCSPCLMPVYSDCLAFVIVSNVKPRGLLRLVVLVLFFMFLKFQRFTYLCQCFNHYYPIMKTFFSYPFSYDSANQLCDGSDLFCLHNHLCMR